MNDKRSNSLYTKYLRKGIIVCIQSIKRVRDVRDVRIVR